MVPVLHRLISKKDDIKKDLDELNLKVFNDDVRLYLHPPDSILATKDTPVWIASSVPEAPEGVQYKQVSGVRSIRNRVENKRI